MTLSRPAHFINRELSWLDFNERVLEEALDPKTPLLERVKFFCIFSSNLDEFFEVRVAGIKQQIESDVVERSIDGLTATETFQAINRKVRQLVERQCACWRDQLKPEVISNIEKGLELTVEQIARAEAQRVATAERTRAFFESYDL